MLGYGGHGHVAVSQTRGLKRIGHWWPPSTGCPVVAGALCAVALMFNICALAHGWQELIQADGHISTLHTPSWKTGLKATSLALSAVAYILYLLAMILHLDSVKGYLVTVFGWLASAIILFSLIGVEVQQHRQDQAHQDLIYTQNFFSSILAAGLYVLVAILLATYIVSVQVSAYSSAEKRIIECTSIVFRVNTFVILLLGGAAMYSSIESWSLMDALYFTDYTVMTIGIGNLTPRTHLGRSLLFPYATCGIIGLGLVVTAVASFTSRIRDLKLRHKIEEARRDIYNAELSEKKANNISTDGDIQSQTDHVGTQFPKGKEVLKLRTVKSDFYRRRRWAELGLFLAAWFLLWFLSASIFRQSEKDQGWTYFVALYFTYTSLTTIGYGDYYPTSNFGKVFFIFWSLLALPILTNLVSVMGAVFHRWLVYCSGHIWRRVFRRGRAQKHHGHGCTFHSRGAADMNATNNSISRPRPRHSSLSNESYTQGLSKTDHDMRFAPMNNAQNDWGWIEHEQVKSRKASTRYRLLLSEEISNLFSMMKDEAPKHPEELCCMWSRIIPLLHPGEDVAVSLDSAKSRHEMRTELMDPKEVLSERNAEISWMLALLLDKLCMDLREELSEAM